jgi:hypothetical protein
MVWAADWETPAGQQRFFSIFFRERVKRVVYQKIGISEMDISGYI